MKALLNNERAPTTFGAGFIKTSFSQYCEAFTNWWKELEIDFETSSFEANLKEALLRRQPLQTPQNRYLITETQSPWTAIFSNARNRSDVSSSVAFLCKVLNCRGVVVQCSPNLTKRKGIKSSVLHYGAISFTLHGPHQTDWLNNIRHVSARNDGGRWVFFQQGEIQTYEQLEQYKNKRVQDRFTPDMLGSYCAALGIQLFDETFYGQRNFLVNQLTKFPSTSPQMTYQEAQARLYR